MTSITEVYPRSEEVHMRGGVPVFGRSRGFTHRLAPRRYAPRAQLSQ